MFLLHSLLKCKLQEVEAMHLFITLLHLMPIGVSDTKKIVKHFLNKERKWDNKQERKRRKEGKERNGREGQARDGQRRRKELGEGKENDSSLIPGAGGQLFPWVPITTCLIIFLNNPEFLSESWHPISIICQVPLWKPSLPPCAINSWLLW